MNADTEHMPIVEHPVVKHTPAEFLVRESVLVPLQDSEASEEGRYTYLELRKSGLTTFEAVGSVAQYFGLPPTDVQFAGLKDEDGVSEQLIALDRMVPMAALCQFNAEHGRDPHRFIRLRHYGTGDEPLRTGGLTGNSFRLRIRNLSPRAASRMALARRYEFHFLNYYDTQRFGVAGAPKTTHLIGRALLSDEHFVALELLRAAGTPESASAIGHTGRPEEFFASLNPRVTSFFKSSYASYVWNDQLRTLISSTRPSDTYEECEGGIRFLFCRRQADVLALLARQRALEYMKYYGKDGPEGRVGLRSTVVQAQIHCHEVTVDDLYTSGHQCDLSFFLPSGAYATMCVRQLANTLDLGGDDGPASYRVVSPGEAES